MCGVRHEIHTRASSRPMMLSHVSVLLSAPRTCGATPLFMSLRSTGVINLKKAFEGKFNLQKGKVIAEKRESRPKNME